MMMCKAACEKISSFVVRDMRVLNKFWTAAGSRVDGLLKRAMPITEAPSGIEPTFDHRTCQAIHDGPSSRAAGR